MIYKEKKQQSITSSPFNSSRYTTISLIPVFVYNVQYYVPLHFQICAHGLRPDTGQG